VPPPPPPLSPTQEATSVLHRFTEAINGQTGVNKSVIDFFADVTACSPVSRWRYW